MPSGTASTEKWPGQKPRLRADQILEELNPGLWWCAKIYSSKLTAVLEPEDLVQVGRAAIVEYLAGHPDAPSKSCFARARCSMVDYLRATYGRYPSSARQLQRGHLQFTELFGVYVDDDLTAPIVAAFLESLEPRERAMLEMRLAGHSHDEIGAHFGVTGSRISQILRPLGERYLSAA